MKRSRKILLMTFLLVGWPVICWAVSFSLVGCSAPATEKKCTTINGTLVDISVTQEGSCYSCVMLLFEDGRVQKLRMNYDKPLLFKIGEENTITFDKRGTIQKVEIKPIVGGDP